MIVCQALAREKIIKTKIGTLRSLCWTLLYYGFYFKFVGSTRNQTRVCSSGSDALSTWPCELFMMLGLVVIFLVMYMLV